MAGILTKKNIQTFVKRDRLIIISFHCQTPIAAAFATISHLFINIFSKIQLGIFINEHSKITDINGINFFKVKFL